MEDTRRDKIRGRSVGRGKGMPAGRQEERVEE